MKPFYLHSCSIFFAISIFIALVTKKESLARYYCGVSELLILEKLQGKTADEVTAAIIARLKPHKRQLHTITSDNGKEFAGHLEIAAKLNIDLYFARPYHSWVRGSNENLNGLVRQYIPKKPTSMS
jgi:IS30 family transposase